MNEICPKCNKPIHLYDSYWDSIWLLDNITELLKKYEVIGWMADNGVVILYHKACLPKDESKSNEEQS